MTDEEPIAWRVDACSGLGTWSDPDRMKTAIREEYTMKSAADARKVHLQQNGMIASVTPVFIKRTKKFIRKFQTNPFGDFRKPWALAD